MSFNQDPKIVVRYGLFFNSKEVTYSDYDTDVTIPLYESSDGPTVNWVPRWLITNREYVLGAKAAMVHDYMCRHKSKYSRNIASKMLRDIWIESGLHPIKGYIIYFLVDLYQWFKFRKEWKS